MAHPSNTHYFGSTVPLEIAYLLSGGSRSTSAVYSEPPCFSMLSLPGSLYLQASHTPIYLLAHFRRSNLLWINCFIRAVLVWPPDPQTNAAMLVNLVGSKLFWLRAALGSPPTFNYMQYVYFHAYMHNNSAISSSLLLSGLHTSH